MPAQPWQSVSEQRQLLLLALGAAAFPFGVVDVLDPPRRIGPTGLQMRIGRKRDADVGPGGRQAQRLAPAVVGRGIGDLLAIGVDEAEIRARA